MIPSNNKNQQFFSSSPLEEIKPENLPFDLKTPPKEVTYNVLFATNLYAYKFKNCIYCEKREEKAECCGGKKVIARCSKLNIEELAPPSCLFCSIYESKP